MAGETILNMVAARREHRLISLRLCGEPDFETSAKRSGQPQNKEQNATTYKSPAVYEESTLSRTGDVK